MANERVEVDLRGWYPRETKPAEPLAGLFDGVKLEVVDVLPPKGGEADQPGLVRFRLKAMRTWQ